MSKRKETYTLELVRPDGMTVAEMKEYIKVAVQAWGGGSRPPGSYGEDDPGDPMFGYAHGVKVKRVKNG